MSTKIKNIFRWIAVFPASILAGWLAWIIITFGNRLISGSQGIDIDSFIFRAGIEFMASFLMGGAYVFAGACVAPNYKKFVASVLAGLGLMVFGYTLFHGISVRDYWLVWASFATIAGIAIVIYSTHVEDKPFGN